MLEVAGDDVQVLHAAAAADVGGLLDEAAAETDAAASNAKYQEAEALLAADMPSIPMWYGKTTMGWSEKVTGVKITAFGTIDFSSVSMK